MSNKQPAKNPVGGDVEAFLREASRLPARSSQSGTDEPRLLFALDATASRQATWNRARHLQHDMFTAAAGLRGLSMQVAFYRGLNEFRASRWSNDADELLRAMNGVRCLGGQTQIARLLRHARREAENSPLRAVVFIGDALEEAVDPLCALAGELGLLRAPLFLFQEGRDVRVARAFQQMARVSGGAWASFDADSAQRLGELLSAVARYASGGSEALSALADDGSRALLEQLGGGSRP